MRKYIYTAVIFIFLSGLGAALLSRRSNLLITNQASNFNYNQKTANNSKNEATNEQPAENVSAIPGETTIDTNQIEQKSATAVLAEPPASTREIKITNGQKHNIPLEEILSGGPPKDGIPSIDEPKFVSVNNANKWLKDEEPGIALSINGINRFYPYQILVWHEIVNDSYNGRRVLVTYCPLCLTGIVFDPVVKGQRVEFGTSGKLWQSNLIMYDRLTDSLWSQVLGEAIVGEQTGRRLALIPSDQIKYRDWKRKFSNGQVLSKNTGTIRAYGSSPYGDYFDVTGIALNLANPKDTRLPNDAFVFGMFVNEQAKGYHVDSIKKAGEVIDKFAGETLIFRWDSEIEAAKVFRKTATGEERITPFSGFWFSWAAAHPNTELFK